MAIENEDIDQVLRHFVSVQNSGNVHMVAELAIGEVGANIGKKISQRLDS